MTWDRDPENTNVAYVLTPAFAPYVGKDPAVFRCPSDRFVSPVQQSRGWRYRVRTVSMNSHVGTSVTVWGGSFPTYLRLQDFTEPSATFVFAEEHPGSINDSSFATDPEGTRFPARARIIDVPASFHNRGAHFSFADGHVELHRWVGPRVPQPVEGGRYVTLAVPAPRDPDALWLGQHAAQLR
jgi:prepilin-type processing-associated H-X9-DG protein